MVAGAFDCICRRGPNDRLLMSFDKAGKINTSHQRTHTHTPPLSRTRLQDLSWCGQDVCCRPVAARARASECGLRFHLVFDWIFNYSLLLVAIYLAGCPVATALRPLAPGPPWSNPGRKVSLH